MGEYTIDDIVYCLRDMGYHIELQDPAWDRKNTHRLRWMLCRVSTGIKIDRNLSYRAVHDFFNAVHKNCPWEIEITKPFPGMCLQLRDGPAKVLCEATFTYPSAKRIKIIVSDRGCSVGVDNPYLWKGGVFNYDLVYDKQGFSTLVKQKQYRLAWRMLLSLFNL